MQSSTIENFVKYTDEDHQIWSLLIKKHDVTRNAKASREYKLSLEKLNILGNNIPEIEAVNASLLKLTGWKLCPVTGLVPEEEFFKLLSIKQFPVVHFIRPMDSLDYFDVPDLFHDLYAHVPLLSNPYYSEFLSGLSKISEYYAHDPFVIGLLSRIYWYTMETGLIFEDNNLKIFGAAVLSSRTESDNVYNGSPEILPYNVSQIIDTPYNYFLQTKYFVINSFEELCESLTNVRQDVIQRYTSATPGN